MYNLNKNASQKNVNNSLDIDRNKRLRSKRRKNNMSIVSEKLNSNNKIQREESSKKTI